MAALSLSATSISLSCYLPPNRRWCCQLRPPLLISCSAPSGKGRARRKLMSDADLCSGLREFISSFGFPDGHVPSTKELAEHGRKDLANIVRRRGYKVVGDLLLANSIEGNKGSNLLDSSIKEEQNVLHGIEDISGQGKKVKVLTGEALDTGESVSSSEDRLESKTELDGVHLDEKKDMSIGPQNGSSLQKKVEKFLKHGSLNFVAEEDNINSNFWLNDAQGHGEYSENSTEPNSSIQDQWYSRSLASDKTGSLLMNGTSVMSKSVTNPALRRNKMRDNGAAHEVPSNAVFDQDIDFKISEMENQAEVERLKYMLQQKELELSRLKELMEKEEESLSILQSQAEDEINKAQKLISEMDAELLAAQDSLAGLKEVQILYSEEGQLVELAGSFNGWHQNIKMDPQPSSTNKDPTESRKPRLWSTLLWLYPGEYEIKFVVDGEWKVDPAKETTITRSGIQNNILRVH